jgi:hypothetical protein
MLTNPTTVASHRDAVEPSSHASLHAPLVGGGVTAATGAGETHSIVPTSPAPVLITEQQVRFATAAAGVGSHTAAIHHSWIVALWQRLSLSSSAHRPPRRRHYPQFRSSYIEHAAMAREMERL